MRACNRRKGNKEVPTYAPPETQDIRRGTLPLRQWQERAIEVVRKTTSPTLIEACPGAGKTHFGLEVARQMFESNEINRVLVVAPTVRTVQQWVKASTGVGGGPKLPFAPDTWRPSDPIYETVCGAAFTWATLTANPTQMEALAAEPGYRTLVILDEVHHAGTIHSYGLVAQQSFGASAHSVLSITGTPFRHASDPIAFLRYVDGKAVTDFSYSYGEALTDEVCRPVHFIQIGGSTTFKTPDQETHKVTFEEDLTKRGESYRLRTALDEGGDLIEFMIRQADFNLARLRASTDPDAGGLIVCMDCTTQTLSLTSLLGQLAHAH